MLFEPDSISFTARSAPRGFLVVEGVNGAGKSTFIRAISTYLASKGLAPRLTFEPGGTAAGMRIRELLLSPPDAAGKLDALSEIFLFAADRRENVMKVVQPAIADGAPIISDRYFYSTLAFQGYGRGIDHATIQNIMNLATGGLLPDFVVLLDLDPAEGLKRTAQRHSTENDAFEAEALAFHRRLRDGFRTMARELPEPFIELDARRSSAELLTDLTPALDRWIDVVWPAGAIP